MGDFAAGKVLTQIEIAAVEVGDFDQWVTDVDGFVGSHADYAEGLGAAGPAAPQDVDQLVGMITPGTPSELLVCLMQWRDGGFTLKEYEIHPCQQIISDFAAGNFVIGHDLDDEALVMSPEDGMLTPVGEDLGAFLGRFRFELCGGRLEWADGWIEKAG